jgi:hypothetical protein
VVKEDLATTHTLITMATFSARARDPITTTTTTKTTTGRTEVGSHPKIDQTLDKEAVLLDLQ